VRLLEDRLLRNVNKEFVTGVRNVCRDLTRLEWPEITIRQLLGRVDFVLSFGEPRSSWPPTDKVIPEGLAGLFNSDWIDRLGTSIARNEA